MPVFANDQTKNIKTCIALLDFLESAQLITYFDGKHWVGSVLAELYPDAWLTYRNEQYDRGNEDIAPDIEVIYEYCDDSEKEQFLKDLWKTLKFRFFNKEDENDLSETEGAEAVSNLDLDIDIKKISMWKYDHKMKKFDESRRTAWTSEQVKPTNEGLYEIGHLRYSDLEQDDLIQHSGYAYWDGNDWTVTERSAEKILELRERNQSILVENYDDEDGDLDNPFSTTSTQYWRGFSYKPD